MSDFKEDLKENEYNTHYKDTLNSSLKSITYGI